MNDNEYAEKNLQRSAKKLPALLVLHEKHGTIYFHVPDVETLKSVALKIVTERHKSGHWYPCPGGKEPIKPDVGDLASLPKDLVEPAKKKLAVWKSQHRAWREVQDTWEQIEGAVKSGNGAIAWAVLTDRSDGEYERVTLEDYSSPSSYRG